MASKNIDDQLILYIKQLEIKLYHTMIHEENMDFKNIFIYKAGKVMVSARITSPDVQWR